MHRLNDALRAYKGKYCAGQMANFDETAECCHWQTDVPKPSRADALHTRHVVSSLGLVQRGPATRAGTLFG